MSMSYNKNDSFFTAKEKEMKIRKDIACLTHTINTKQEISAQELRDLHIRLNALTKNIEKQEDKDKLKNSAHQTEEEKKTKSQLFPIVPNFTQQKILLDKNPHPCNENIKHYVHKNNNNEVIYNQPSLTFLSLTKRRKRQTSTSKGKISKTDLRVSFLPPLPACAKGICCPNKCELLTRDTNLQQRIRNDYCDFVRENDHAESNLYLASFLDPNNSYQGQFDESIRYGRISIPGATVGCVWCSTDPSTAFQWLPHKCSRNTCLRWKESQNFYMRYANIKKFRYVVPMIYEDEGEDEKKKKDDGGNRSYLNVCLSTFQALYGLSSDRLTSIRKLRNYQA